MLGLGNSIISSGVTPIPFGNSFSLEFDGVNDYLDLGDSNDFSFGDGSTDSAFSLSIWCKSTDITGTTLISKSTTVSAEREYYLYFGGNDKLYFALWDASTDGYTYSNTSGALTSIQGSWTHVVATYDGSGANTGQKIYINGESQTLTRATGTIGSGAYVAMENTAYPLKIGSLLSGYFFTGDLDEASMWNKELSAIEVAAYFNDGSPTDLSGQAGLVGWWRMGESATFPTIPDASSNSNNATMTNMSSGDITTDFPGS
jgi:hypothetical protein